MMERIFHLRENRTSVRTEILGGVTTFVTMAYIVVVNPAILKTIGIPPGPSTVATILTAVFGCLLMGFYANRPIAVAPYMGENAFIAFGLAALGIAWQQALGAVFISGVAFALLTLFGLRRWLADAISPSMKHSFAVGIGLFLALIGLFETGVVTSAGVPDVPLKLGRISAPETLLAIFGFIVMVTLLARGVRGGLLLGMAVTALVGIVLGHGHAPRAIGAVPFVGDYSLGPIALQLDIPSVLRLSFLPVLLTLFLMGFLDTLGTLVGVGAAGDLLDQKGDFPAIERPMMVDAVSCVFGGLIGTTTSGAYIESATGIRDGARTGLAAVTTAGLFAISLFFVPLIEPLQALRYAYAPALVVVGLLMLGQAKQIDFSDFTEAAPAFATIAMMVFTYNIANGLTAGLLLYPLFKVLTGRSRELRGGSIALAALCAVYYLFGLPH